MTKYDELKQAIAEYGEAAMENLVRCKALGRAVVDGFADYLQCPPEKVVGVPAQGQFDPRHHYGDAAFSFHGAKIIRLEPIEFGICVIVDNVEDSGALWLRTALRIEVTGDSFDIFVANQPMVQVPLEFTGELTPIFEAIHTELMGVFRKELAEFNDARFAGGIGFISPS
ncbi:MAG: hypothetical protein ACWA5L_07105 [bacterium]